VDTSDGSDSWLSAHDVPRGEASAACDSRPNPELNKVVWRDTLRERKAAFTRRRRLLFAAKRQSLNSTLDSQCT